MMLSTCLRIQKIKISYIVWFLLLWLLLLLSCSSSIAADSGTTIGSETEEEQCTWPRDEKHEQSQMSFRAFLEQIDDASNAYVNPNEGTQTACEPWKAGRPWSVD
jgi:hypothetical protein